MPHVAPFAVPGNRPPANATVAGFAALTCLAVTGLSDLPDEVLAAALLPPLENRFARTHVADPETIAGVIALGGGDNRIAEAGRLARRWPHVRLLVTGAGPTDDIYRTIGPGIARDRVIIEAFARTTSENATLSAALLQRLPPNPSQRATRWLVVTSAHHMPRAIGAFRNAGVDVEAWPVDGDQTTARVRLEAARHEWLGLGWYWLTGRSNTLFPGTQDDSPRRSIARNAPRQAEAPQS